MTILLLIHYPQIVNWRVRWLWWKNKVWWNWEDYTWYRRKQFNFQVGFMQVHLDNNNKFPLQSPEAHGEIGANG